MTVPVVSRPNEDLDIEIIQHALKHGRYFKIGSTVETNAYAALARVQARQQQLEDALEEAESQRDAMLQALSAEEPPDEVFVYFQRLHGLPVIGGPDRRYKTAEAALREIAAVRIHTRLPDLQGCHDARIEMQRIARAALAVSGGRESETGQ